MIMSAILVAAAVPAAPAQEVYAATTPQFQKVFEALKSELDGLNENEFVKGNYHYDTTIEDDVITVKQVADSKEYEESVNTNPCIFNWQDGYVTCASSENDYATLMLFTGYVVGAVEKTLGMGKGSIGEYK